MFIFSKSVKTLMINGIHPEIPTISCSHQFFTVFLTFSKSLNTRSCVAGVCACVYLR